MLSDRRSFLEKMSQIGALSLLPLAAAPAAGSQAAHAAGVPPVANDKNHFVAGPYLQNMGSDEVTIMWITHKTVSAGSSTARVLIRASANSATTMGLSRRTTALIKLH
ncbi:hypothetical protein [Dyadobacter sp. OTU695]|uniref:hypothetical protein n=1 Tax=Dyadobacter sp. OTU695 TaxID=3043860 RepID=UPI00313ED07A